MRLSRIWRILQVEESVIHRGRRPRWIKPSEICRILHILRKPNSIIALLFIQNIFFAQTCKLYSRPFLSLLNDTTLCPGFLGQWFNNLRRQWFNDLQWAALLTSFWRQWFNNLQRTALLTSLVQYDIILGQQQLFMLNYACGFNQLETGKYFEWIIKIIIAVTTVSEHIRFEFISCRQNKQTDSTNRFHENLSLISDKPLSVLGERSIFFSMK